MNRMLEFIVEMVKIQDNMPHIISDVYSLGDIRYIPLNRPARKPPCRPKHLWSICHTSGLIGDFVQK